MAGRSESWPPLTVVSGPAGAGKTHLVRERTDPSRRVWLTLRGRHDGTELASLLIRHVRARVGTLPASLAAAVGPSRGPVSDADPLSRSEQLGSLIARELDAVLHRQLVLILDELEHLAPESGALRLVESLVRNAPSRLAVVIVTRDDVPFSVARLRRDQRLEEISAAELLFDHVESTRLLADIWPSLTDWIDTIAGVSRGNPGVLLAIGGLAAALPPPQRHSTIAELSDESSPILAAVARRYVLSSDRERALVDDLAVFGDATMAELVRLGHIDPDQDVAALVAAQLVEDHPVASGHVTLTRAAAAVVQLEPTQRTRSAFDAVRLAIGRGDAGAAIAAAGAHGSHELVTTTVTRYGPAAIDAGHARLVLETIDELGTPAALRGLAGRAAQAVGDWQRALVEYRAAADHAVCAGDAWRHGLIEYFQGDTTTAAAVYERALATVGDDDPLSDRATLSGYAGATAWIAGDLDQAREHAERSLELATRAQDDAAMAVAYTLAAMVAASDGDRVNNDWHYVRALQHAERAGDVWQIARIRSNRGSRLMEEGDYEAALEELDDAVRYADVGGYGVMLALALTNRGEVLTKVGRLDDARTDLTAAVDLLQRQGSRIVAYPLVQLARLFHVRGDLEQARGSCERALAISDSSADQQLGASAHVQLARALAERDPDAAAERAALAADIGSLDAPEAWSVVGMLAVQRGDLDDAAAAAATAAELARGRRDRYALATALEVAALAELDPSARRRRLEESYTLFDELACPIDAGRVEVRLAAERLDSFGVTRVAAVAELAQRLGARPLLAQAAEVLGRVAAADRERLAVTVLGSFAVTLDGAPIPLAAWQSKKARDLFKMIVALRGRPLPRERAIERLWPGDDPAKVGNKLSVALATIRSVLDPGKEFPSGHYVRADGDSVQIDTTTVSNDVDRFLSMADAALSEHRRSSGRRSAGMLSAVESAYSGDVFEDDPYVDWFVPLREEARAVYLTVTRELASLRLDHGETDDAIRLLLRLLEREPYDESAHLDLVMALTRVGRLGDARRRYQHYADRMRELEMEPRSFPGDARERDPRHL